MFNINDPVLWVSHLDPHPWCPVLRIHDLHGHADTRFDLEGGQTIHEFSWLARIYGRFI